MRHRGCHRGVVPVLLPRAGGEGAAAVAGQRQAAAPAPEGVGRPGARAAAEGGGRRGPGARVRRQGGAPAQGGPALRRGPLRRELHVPAGDAVADDDRGRRDARRRGSLR